MSIWKNIFGKKEKPITNYADFWKWFEANAQQFYTIVKSGDQLEEKFFSPLSDKLKELKEGYWYVTGMCADDCAELIITPDGIIKNIVFAEELVAAAPRIAHWKFTALKPMLDLKDVNIEMSGSVFNSDNLSFYSNDYEEYPDEVDIVVVHPDYTEEEKDRIFNGVMIFLDNYLGELNGVTMIDAVSVCGAEQAEKELIPISKLKDFLLWREKEFVEKYNGIRYDTVNDQYSALEGKLQNGWPAIAVINTTLLEWDGKASHPWMLKIRIKYDGENNNGMPDRPISDMMNAFEDEIMEQLRDVGGYLNVGRQTLNNVRDIYIACSDFRGASKVVYEMEARYAGKLELEWEIFKDKYWRCLEMFMGR